MLDDDAGFVAFGNRASRKGRELEANPHAALCFGVLTQHRQVRAEGAVELLPEAETEAYFRSRPRGSRLAAWVSEEQSAPIASRLDLEQRFAEVDARWPGDDIPRPPTWSGMCLRAEAIEFWQGRLNRMHDRLVYRRSGPAWEIERLTP